MYNCGHTDLAISVFNTILIVGLDLEIILVTELTVYQRAV